MAGAPIVQKDSLPDFHQTVSITASQSGGKFSVDQILFYAEREMVLESAFITYRQNGTTSDQSSILLKTGTGTAVASGTTISSALVLDKGSAADRVGEISILGTQNLIPEGNWIGVDFTDTDSSTNDISNATFHLRFRTRIG